MNDFFRQNHLNDILHNEKDIWYCKYELLSQDISKIAQANYKVKLIVGNSDESFTIKDLKNLPTNVEYVFASNNTCADEKKIFSLPLGIESVEDAKRKKHGIGFKFAEEKEVNIKRVREKKPINYKNLILCNFSLQTNYPVRKFLLDNCLNKNHISVQMQRQSYFNYFDEVSNHRAVLCPIGNGLDTVRTYETLYCNRVPIIFGSDIIYNKILFDLPCVYLENVRDISNEMKMIEKILEAETKIKNMEKAYLTYWIKKIKSL
jgi:hypothetical protein